MTTMVVVVVTTFVEATTTIVVVVVVTMSSVGKKSHMTQDAYANPSYHMSVWEREREREQMICIGSVKDFYTVI